MRFVISESMCDVRQYLPLARAAEAAGFDGFAVGDSILYPESSSTRYPYTASGDRTFLDGAPFLDPFQLFAALSVVTDRLELMTGVLKLPIRHPVLVAKQASSLAVLTRGRFVLGVGLGSWPEDYEACGQAWADRGARMDEMIGIVRGLMGGGFFEWHGRFYDVPRIKLCPTPSRCPRIVIGGHSEGALLRAARLADGFYFTGVPTTELPPRIARLRSLLEASERTSADFRVYVGMTRFELDEARRLRDLGVTDLLVRYRDLYSPDRMALSEKLDWIARFGRDVIATDAI